MEQKEFLSKIQLSLFATNSKVWFFSATIILGAEVWKKQMKPTTKQTSKCISVLPILRRIWQDWNYMYSYMYLRIFPCCIHSDCFFFSPEEDSKAFNSLQWLNNFINSNDNNTKLPCYTLQPTQHHSFFRNLPCYSTDLHNCF